VASSTGAGVDVRKDGVLQVVKGKRTAPMPTTPEQYRAVMKVMALHWEMVHLKGAGRAILKDYDPSVIDRHVEYILGDQCMLIAEANPTMTAGPSWDLLMKYEHEVRRFAIKKVNEAGATLAEGFALARASMEHRTNYFATPLAMPGARVAPPRTLALPAPDVRGAKRTAEEALVPYTGGGASPPSTGKGKDKGKGKGKKGKSDPTLDQLKAMAPKAAYKYIRASPGRYGARFKASDGSQRCHNYQTGVCSVAGCKYTHGCLRCGGAHGVTKCPELGLDAR